MNLKQKAKASKKISERLNIYYVFELKIYDEPLSVVLFNLLFLMALLALSYVCHALVVTDSTGFGYSNWVKST